MWIVCRGCDGTVLWYGTLQAEVERDPLAFVEKLAFVEVPPDALFTVRFNG